LTGRQGLDTPVQFLKGVGPKRSKLLAKLGITTIRELLFHVPRRYVDRSRTLAVRDLKPGEDVTVFARVVTGTTRRTRNFRKMFSCIVRDETGMTEVVWFNRPDLEKRLKPGQELMLSGKVTSYRGRAGFTNPGFELVKPGSEASGHNAVIPVYPMTEGLSAWSLRRIIRAALDTHGELVEESLPPEVLDQYRLPPVRRALEDVHFPREYDAALRARARFVYEELFFLELVLALRHRRNSVLEKGERHRGTGQLTGPFRQGLGFKYTGAQARVIAEMRGDMAGPGCMSRLLQGDVGSGKTVVAVEAMLVACESGAQAVMMAPTEILAVQHYRGWSGALAGLEVEARLLTGSTRKPERREILAGLESGDVKMVFGTHALIESDVRFERLGLVVVDEQHRFGVMQRAALMNKGWYPDVLVMTATPIPRTLAMTVYGDLDVSVLDEKPPGRKDVVTRLVPEAKRPKVYGYVEERVSAGEQVFVVCPVIEESEKLELKSATATFDRIRAAFPGRNVGLVHGRMKGDEREEAMSRFRARDLDILVSTTVIEVGVDIPNASVMVIEHPERFGLAQLHQLRGRIGRGGQRAVCVLMVPRDPVGETGERLRFFASTTDGFRLAEKDIELRGPGEILGTRQHGLPDLRIADVIRDSDDLRRARRDAFRLVELDPGLERPENEAVRKTLTERYRGRAELFDVG